MYKSMNLLCIMYYFIHVFVKILFVLVTYVGIISMSLTVERLFLLFSQTNLSSLQF